MGADMKRQIRMLIDQFGGPYGTRIYNMYHNVLPRVVDILYENGYKIASPKGLKEKHVAVIAKAISQQGLPQQTLDMIWMAMKSWAKWVGKPTMVRPIEAYVALYERDEQQLPE
ncbi:MULTISPECIES: hypothetical protein [Paraburkholderia]|uniref:hypothetical protein n=1 Tax=Paraburkholderia TaxID=1822464 RepID=UPI0003790B70|nr:MULTISPECIES: hypothetical protein [Paraburkholderia]MDH6147278.1 site-specific recombinase XerC [Paraburkholderia sp. WSM4179]